MRFTKIVLSVNILLGFAFPNPLLAQTHNVKDYIVVRSGDTLHGTVKHRKQSGINPKDYKKIRFNPVNGKKKNFKRKDVIAFRSNNMVYEAFWLNQSSYGITLFDPKYSIDPRRGEQYFLKVVSKGNLSHYLMEWYVQEDASLMSMPLLKKQNDHFFIRATQGIFGLKRKVLTNYFKNCPEIKEKLGRKQFKSVGELVHFYNGTCTNGF